MNSIDDEYQNAINNGDTQYAAYLQKIMNGLSGDSQSMQSVGMTQQPSGAANTSTGGNNAWGNLTDWGSQLFGNLFSGKSVNSSDPGDAAYDQMIQNSVGNQAMGAASDVASAVGSGIDFITDIPRVATTLIGGLMIAAGLFSLAGGSHTQVIEMIRKTP